jgi:hypothetical protein
MGEKQDRDQKEEITPVILFAYARPDCLRRTLDGLRANRIPLLYIFCDGSKSEKDRVNVHEVQQIARGVNWCETRLTCREENLGLGRSVLMGVTDVLSKYTKVIVFEDDIVAAPGTYQFMCEALRVYENNTHVMSVSAWTHPKIRPPQVARKSFFTGRFASWGWGTWRRAWEGMDTPAPVLLRQCRWRWVNVERYGTDIPYMAEHESELNIWAARFALLHMLRRGLCLHPPQSLVENIGMDGRGANVVGDFWAQDSHLSMQSNAWEWPIARETKASVELWQLACGMRYSRVRTALDKIVKLFGHVGKLSSS